MKKYIFLLLSFSFVTFYSCQEEDLTIMPENLDPLETSINTIEKLQGTLNGAYVKSSSAGALGAHVFIFGDLLSDNIFVSNSASSYLLSYNMNYTAVDNEFGFYSSFYDVIQSCNTVINNTTVEETDADVNEILRIKGEASILRAISYFNLVSYYSAAPTSGLNQEYGVPLVTGSYDPNIQPPRASVAEVYDQIISDLQFGMQHAPTQPSSKVMLSKTAAKLFLSRVYLTRRAGNDVQLALDLSTDIINSSPNVFSPVPSTSYVDYFSATDNTLAENQSETIWEIDLNTINNPGVNAALAVYYHRTGSRRSFLFRQTFVDSFPETDVRKGLFTTQSVPTVDAPKGVWTNKWIRSTSDGNFTRNNKVMRFAEAQLNRIEALYLLGNANDALIELNAFATSRGGNTYTGNDLLTDILNERRKEFYAEGYRFHDLKRHNLPIVKETNCHMNCDVPANSLKFVLPISESALIYNPNLTQYPGY